MSTTSIRITAMDYPQTRRVRLYAVNIRHIARFFFGQRRVPHAVEIPEIDFPPDANVLAAFFNWASNNLEILVEHPSFDEIDEGMDAPLHTAMMAWKTYKLEQQSDDPFKVIGVST